jgi:uncharacterized membrane protein YqiK
MKEKELREAESRAKQQTFITESELSIDIQTNQGKAEYERSRQEAARIQTQAMAIEEQVRAYGGPRLQLTQQVLNRFAEAIQVSQVDVVPKILIAGHDGKEGGSPMTGNVMEALLTLMLSDRVGADIGSTVGPRTPAAETMRKKIQDDLSR